MKKNATILVVEDEGLLLSAIATKLNLNGLKPVACASGEEAIEYLKKAEELPGVIWLDYHLKGMDGLFFLKEIKANPLWEHIPVVVVSNSASPDKVHSMLALGANKYLLKADYRLDQIIETVLEFVDNGEK